MSMHHVVPSISAFAWGPGGKSLALCPNTEEIWIYENTDQATKSWKKTHELRDHTMVVEGLDWHWETNKIVSCSHDRQAFVWSLDEDGKKWKSGLVVLKTPLAAISAKWSPDGSSFVVTTSDKSVVYCEYYEEEDWWIGYPVRKNKSAVLDVAWRPNSDIPTFATASADMRCMVFAASSRSSGAESKDDGTGPSFDRRQTFSAQSWVESVSWSPSGEHLAYTCHDSTVVVVSFSSGVATSALVVAGHDMKPGLVSRSDGSWAFERWLDVEERKEEGKQKSSFAAARNMFKGMTERGETTREHTILTKHEAPITKIAVKQGGKGKVKVFTTSSLDGRLVDWDVDELGLDKARLKL